MFGLDVLQRFIYRRTYSQFDGRVGTLTSKIITPLRFDKWLTFLECGGHYVQQLIGNVGLLIQRRRQLHIANRIASRTCACCGGTMVPVHRSEINQLFNDVMLCIACTTCGYWKFGESEGSGIDTWTIPFARGFDQNIHTPSLVQLAKVIRADPEKLNHLHPTQFEILVGSILREFYECEVRHVGRSGDDGVDLIAIIKDSPTLVQVKRRIRHDAIEGIEVVKLLFASAFAQGAISGMVVTTAQRFSRPAQRWIQTQVLHDAGFSMDLVQLNDFMHMVEATNNMVGPDPWRLFVEPNTTSEESHVKIQQYTARTGDFIMLEQPHQPTRYYACPLNRVGSGFEILPTRGLKVDLDTEMQEWVTTRFELWSTRILEDMEFSELLTMLPDNMLESLGNRWRAAAPRAIVDLDELIAKDFARVLR